MLCQDLQTKGPLFLYRLVNLLLSRKSGQIIMLLKTMWGTKYLDKCFKSLCTKPVNWNASNFYVRWFQNCISVNLLPDPFFFSLIIYLVWAWTVRRLQPPGLSRLLLLVLQTPPISLWKVFLWGQVIQALAPLVAVVEQRSMLQVNKAHVHMMNGFCLWCLRHDLTSKSSRQST